MASQAISNVINILMYFFYLCTELNKCINDEDEYDGLEHNFKDNSDSDSEDDEGFLSESDDDDQRGI